MGFHTRFITKDSILSCKNFEDLDSLFNADALFLDDWSQKFVDKYDNNWQSYQTVRKEVIEKYELSSSFPDTSEFNKEKISNVLINLKNNPSWLDVQLCIEFFRPIDIPQTISGKFDLMCNFCIHLIEGEFEK